MKLIKFSASWCQPCKTLANLLSTVDLPCDIEEIDIDADHDTPAKFMVRGVPTLVAVDDSGNEIDRMVGATSAQALSNWLTTISLKAAA